MASNDNLLAMGLTPINASDEHIRYGELDRRTALTNSVKQTDTSRANYAAIWRKEATGSLVNQVACQIPIWLARISAVVIAGHADGVRDKTLAARYYMCKEETAAWAKKYLRFSTEAKNNKARLKSTAPANTYEVKKI